MYLQKNNQLNNFFKKYAYNRKLKIVCTELERLNDCKRYTEWIVPQRYKSSSAS